MLQIFRKSVISASVFLGLQATFVLLVLSTPRNKCNQQVQLSKTKVLAGVFITKSTSTAILQAFRDSVSNYNSRQHDVSVSLYFFVGKGGNVFGTTDVIESTMPENMNDGKTYAWFVYSARHHPDSDAVLKIDTDTAVNWTRLHSAFQDMKHVPAYLGRVNVHQTCGGFDYCPPKNCFYMLKPCWVYMSGGLYGISRRPLLAISECTFAANNKVGAEDLLVGRWLRECYGDLQLATFNNGQAWCHSSDVNVTHITTEAFPSVCAK